MKFLYFILLSNIFLLSFCQSTVITTPTVSRTSTLTPNKSNPTATNTPQSSATIIPTPVQTSEATRVYFREQDEIQELQAWLVNAYREGLDTTEVQSELLKNGWQKESGGQAIEDYWGTNAQQFLEIDLDGDGEQEWVLTIFTHWDECQFASYENETYGYGGQLWIINDIGLVFSIHPTVEYSFWNAMTPIAVTDMTGDGIPEIVAKSVGCSAHTHFDMYHIVSGHNGEIQNIIDLDTPVYHNIFVLRYLSGDPNESISQIGVSLSKAEDYISDETGDGLADLIIYGGSFNSAGAGHARIHTEVWGWNGSSIVLLDFIPDPPRDRVDILMDANSAYALGNRIEAYALFQEAELRHMLFSKKHI